MKNCVLCKSQARVYCESDQANLCWDCDAKVHGANFLVARHSRSLLCHACQTPTPWKASGAKLGHTVSVCENCVREKICGREEEESEGANDNEIDTEDDLDDDDEEEEDFCGGDDEEGDNQVVPWSSTPPPPAASSSSSGESATMLSLKRLGGNASDLRFQDDLNCSPSQLNHGSFTAMAARSGVEREGEAVSVDYLRPSKYRRTEPNRVEPGSRSTSTLQTLKIFGQECTVSASIVDR